MTIDLPPQVSTVRIQTGAELTEHVWHVDIVVDLTVRGWRPHFAVQQVAAQAGWNIEDFLAGRPPIRLPAAQNEPLTSEHIASWIDFELFGDPVQILASRVAEKTAEEMGAVLVLLPPAPDDLSATDATFISYLVPAIVRNGGKVALSYPDNPWPFENILARGDIAHGPTEMPHSGDLPAGVLDRGIAQRLQLLGIDLGDSTALANGGTVVSPAWRLSKRELPARALSIMPAWGWIANGVLLARSPANVLVTRAWQALQAGDDRLACDLSQLAMSRFGDDSAVVLANQTINIICQRYGNLASVAPVQTRPSRLSHAWGLTMTGAVTEALPVFNTECEQPGSVFDLLLYNIRALAHFRSGEIGIAQALQDAIAKALENPELRSPHLEFLNKLNRARLHRARGEFQEARRLIGAAFVARKDQLSEFDYFYRALLLEDIAGLSGNTRAAREHLVEVVALYCTLQDRVGMPRRVRRLALRGDRTSEHQFIPAIESRLQERLLAAFPHLEPHAFGLKAGNVHEHCFAGLGLGRAGEQPARTRIEGLARAALGVASGFPFDKAVSVLSLPLGRDDAES